MAKKALKYWFIPVFVITLILRLPSLFEPFTYGDEGIYLTLGQALRQGVVFYRDIHDNKPPMLYLLAALAGNFECYRLIFFVWSFGTIFLFYKMAKQLFPKDPLATIISTAVFALLTNLHSFEGNVANAENFMMLPTIAAFYLAFPHLKKASSGKNLTNIKPLFLAGIFLSLATLFKIPAAFDLLALFSLFFLVITPKNYPSVVRQGLITLSGFLTPLAFTFVYYAFVGGLMAYLKAAFFQNIPYLSSWASRQAQIGGLPLLLLGRGLIVFFLVLGLFAFRKRVSFTIQLILIWFAFSWFAALLSARPYPHYLIQTLPALSLATGLFLLKPSKSPKLIIPLLLIFIFWATFNVFHFWRYENFPYYQNFYQYALRLKSHDEYFAKFDPRAKTIYQVADYLKARTVSGERLFIWGNDPFVYALSQRPPVGRYAVAYHIFDFNGFQETIEALNQNPPRYLIISDTENRSFPQLKAFVQSHYLLETTIDGVQIFHRNATINK